MTQRPLELPFLGGSPNVELPGVLPIGDLPYPGEDIRKTLDDLTRGLAAVRASIHRPGVRVYSAATNCTAAATTTLTWASVRYDTGMPRFQRTASDNFLSVPTRGIYAVLLSLEFNPSDTGYLVVDIYNSTTTEILARERLDVEDAAVNWHSNLVWIGRLATDDQIQARVTSSGHAADVPTVVAAQNSPEFAMQRLADLASHEGGT